MTDIASMPRCFLLAASFLFASPVTAAASDGSIVVALVGGADPTILAQETGTELISTLPGQPFALLRPEGDPSPQEMEQLLVLLDSHPSTRYAEQNFAAGLPETNGCGLSGQPTIQQCTLGFVDGSASPMAYERQLWMLRIGLPQAQALSAGLPSRVAVLDTGLDLAHPALEGRIDGEGYDFVLDRPGAWEELNGLDEDGDGLVDEGYGHGTHVAGIVCAVNPDATILPLRVMDSEGNGTAWDVAEGILYATSAGADVVNLSFSFLVHSQLVADALHLCISSGVDVFTSAGNTGAELVLFPGNLASDADTLVPLPPIYPHGVACVAAVDSFDFVAGFSAFGLEVDLCAPGVGIRSTWPGGLYATWSGTSMSCAVASGVASLSQSAAVPSSVPSTVDLLMGSAVPIDESNPGQAGGLGAGRVDALAAVEAALSH